jgi:hypothetical protein
MMALRSRDDILLGADVRSMVGDAALGLLVGSMEGGRCCRMDNLLQLGTAKEEAFGWESEGMTSFSTECIKKTAESGSRKCLRRAHFGKK